VFSLNTLEIGGAVNAAAAAPFVPLAGSAIDMDFVGGNYFGGTLANLMNAGQTQAIGALLTALTTVTAGSLVVSFNAMTVPTGTTWIVDSNGDNLFMKGTGPTTVQSQANAANNMGATLGSGSFAAGAKVGVSWSTGAGRSMVGNNGTVATNGVNFIAGEVDMGFSFPAGVLTNLKRLTYWNTKLSDAALKAFTV
jgi:hypothetical protein